MDFEPLADQFLDHAHFMRGASPATVRRYRATLKAFQKWSEVREIEECSPEVVRAFLESGREEGRWGVSTLVTYLMALGVFFRWCVQLGYLATDPTVGIERPKMPRKIPGRLTKQEAQRLLDVARSYPYPTKFLQLRNHAIVATFLFTGLRKSELLSLQLPDVDLENHSIMVRQGKGSRDRVVPMSPALAGILRVYLWERRLRGKTCPEVFVSSILDQGFTDDGLKRVIRSLVESTRMKFHVHTLRHTFATLMLEGGCDVFALSRMMGHTDIKMTTIYLAASTTHLRGQIAKHPLNALRTS